MLEHRIKDSKKELIEIYNEIVRKYGFERNPFGHASLLMYLGKWIEKPFKELEKRVNELNEFAGKKDISESKYYFEFLAVFHVYNRKRTEIKDILKEELKS